MPDETNTVAEAPAEQSPAESPAEQTLAEKAAVPEEKLPQDQWPTFAIVVGGVIVNHDRNDPKFWSPPEGAAAVDITGHEKEPEAQIGQPWPPLTPEQKAAAAAAKKPA